MELFKTQQVALAGAMMSDGLGTGPASRGQVAEKPGLRLPHAPWILPSEATLQGGEGSVGSVGPVSSEKSSAHSAAQLPPALLPFAFFQREKNRSHDK